MKLELENGRIVLDPGTSHLNEALRAVESQKNDFLILERESKQFMQVALHPEKGFYIEYHHGSEGQHGL